MRILASLLAGAWMLSGCVHAPVRVKHDVTTTVVLENSTIIVMPVVEAMNR